MSKKCSPGNLLLSQMCTSQKSLQVCVYEYVCVHVYVILIALITLQIVQYSYLRVYVAWVHQNLNFHKRITCFAFLFRKEKYVKEKKHSVKDLLLLSIYIITCTLYTGTNTFMRILSLWILWALQDRVSHLDPWAHIEVPYVQCPCACAYTHIHPYTLPSPSKNREDATWQTAHLLFLCQK